MELHEWLHIFGTQFKNGFIFHTKLVTLFSKYLHEKYMFFKKENPFVI